MNAQGAMAWGMLQGAEKFRKSSRTWTLFRRSGASDCESEDVRSKAFAHFSPFLKFPTTMAHPGFCAASVRSVFMLLAVLPFSPRLVHLFVLLLPLLACSGSDKSLAPESHPERGLLRGVTLEESCLHVSQCLHMSLESRRCHIAFASLVQSRRRPESLAVSIRYLKLIGNRS